MHFLELDEAQNKDVTPTYNIRGFPTFVFVRNLREVDRFGGANAQQLEAKIIEHNR